MEGALGELVSYVAGFLTMEPTTILSGQRSKDAAFARYLCMHFAWSGLDLSMPQIAAYFGRRDHTCVIHARNRILRDIDEGRIPADAAETLHAVAREIARRYRLHERAATRTLRRPLQRLRDAFHPHALAATEGWSWSDT